jgi:hypothetical protein
MSHQSQAAMEQQLLNVVRDVMDVRNTSSSWDYYSWDVRVWYSFADLDGASREVCTPNRMRVDSHMPMVITLCIYGVSMSDNGEHTTLQKAKQRRVKTVWIQITRPPKTLHMW